MVGDAGCSFSRTMMHFILLELITLVTNVVQLAAHQVTYTQIRNIDTKQKNCTVFVLDNNETL